MDLTNTSVGIDVAHYQPPARVMWEKLRERGEGAFAFMKGCQGTYRDPTSREHVTRAVGGGVPRSNIGVYAFGDFRLPGVEQAHILLDIIEQNGGDLIPIMDMEESQGRSAEVVVDETIIFMETVQSQLRRPGLLYSYPWFFKGLMRATTRAVALSRYLLWLARPVRDLRHSATPAAPLPFNDWTVLQFDGNGGRLLPSGVDGDFNLFRGSEADFAERMKPYE